jgi:predicted O-linked N-acetylglucosamine transferase (SPINDLY family)
MTSLSDYLARLAADDLDIMPLLAAALDLQQNNHHQDALRLYEAWLALHPLHPMGHAALFNMGFLYDALGRRDKSATAFRRAIDLNPDFPPPYINLGNYLEASGDRIGAASLWTELVSRLAGITPETIEQKLTALKLLGRLFAEADLDSDAETALYRIIEIDPHQTDIAAYWLNMRQRQCQWNLLAPIPAAKRRLVLKAMAPLTLLSYKDDPLWQLATAAAFTDAQLGRLVSTVPQPVRAETEPRRLRIGYLSSDLCEHAVGYLTAEVYGLHDRSRVEVFAYYSGTRTDGTTHQRIRAGVDHWRDIAPLTDNDAARMIVEDGIDILVDLNGHTKDARLGVLARTPAPIIVNWLGFPGTTGSAFHHYIIADEMIIPPESECYYSETVLRLPCYQPLDRQRVVAPVTPSRAELGLPEGAVVYCCFNEPRKITADSWACWMKILAAVPNSVLYLLIPSATTRTRLRDLATEAGVSADRLVFADRRLNPEHLARYGVVDIVLDTFAYGAHTTASDALWMGVPVVTLQGRSFAARVCASLLRAAGLPDLICQTPEAFVAKAVSLGNAPAECAALRTRLREGRDCLLFDTPGLVRALEQLYLKMWDDYLAGRRPRPNLANMALYREIAFDLELDGDSGTPFPESYRRELAARQTYTYVEPDSRLHTES